MSKRLKVEGAISGRIERELDGMAMKLAGFLDGCRRLPPRPDGGDWGRIGSFCAARCERDMQDTTGTGEERAFEGL